MTSNRKLLKSILNKEAGLEILLGPPLPSWYVNDFNSKEELKKEYFNESGNKIFWDKDNKPYPVRKGTNKQNGFMNRSEKINLLQSIKEGREPLSVLKEPGYYCFLHNCDNPGVYELGDKRFTEEEFREFKKKVSKSDQLHIIYIMDYTEDDFKE